MDRTRTAYDMQLAADALEKNEVFCCTHAELDVLRHSQYSLTPPEQMVYRGHPVKIVADPAIPQATYINRFIDLTEIGRASKSRVCVPADQIEAIREGDGQTTVFTAHSAFTVGETAEQIKQLCSQQGEEANV